MLGDFQQHGTVLRRYYKQRNLIQGEALEATRTAYVLTIREAKGHKDRLVLLSNALRDRLPTYLPRVHPSADSAEQLLWLAEGRPVSGGNAYKNFRRFLWQAGISHGGWGRGPRIHDGHYAFQDTAYYLRLTADCFPDITSRVDKRWAA